MQNFRDDVAKVDRLIRPKIRRTPIIEIAPGDFGLRHDFRLFLKLEMLQHAGSFKTRGAFANLLCREVPSSGVAAASGGNHGAAVAFAAHRLGHRATIFVPEISAAAKMERIRSFGADLIVAGSQYAEALDKCAKFIDETDALSIHAYDQYETLLGQGTLGLELDEQIKSCAVATSTILIAVGGGGLIGGVAGYLADRAKVIAVEPENSCALHTALKNGKPVDVAVSGLAADSLGARRVGDLMFPVAKDHVDNAVLVNDGAIAQAQRQLWEKLRLAVEPGGAAAFAALLSGRFQPSEGESVCVVVCGANTDAVCFDC